MKPSPRLLAAVAVGGAVGALLRYGAGELAADPTGFPVTTFVVNVVGSALLAGVVLLVPARRSPMLAAALGPGVLGGFTTFSATSEQGRALLAEGRPALALTYLLGTLAAAVAAAGLVGLYGPRRAPVPAEAER